MSSQATSLSFEQALSELEQIVQKLETGDASLDEAIAAYSRGIELKNQCQKRLESARLQVEKIQFPDDGSDASIEPFDSE
ncbi:exodeoxyribonuclease VII small subunit [Alphaproteobacteria bacterium]|nr:exodeoxyribonuclease VII small subunit [Alphaproteobacteria bacterium]MBT5799677.1 exodeoxyribonuclease VII small subunit [Alphaproteobacteria bacterium]MDC0394963.1 exodeoxyribonuclease VII small subunit [Alphaproteobacteria bacterium]